jgi:membrane fusion protein, multidrug efflux system
MAQTIDQVVTDREEVPTIVAEEASTKEEFNSSGPRAKWSRWIVLFVSGMALTAATLWWLNSRNYVSTDDAQVDGHLDVVSTRINGTVTYVNPQVENNQFVKDGTLLLELDPRDYEAELEHATANLATATADEHSALVNFPIVDASAFGQLHAAEAAKDEALASLDSDQANLGKIGDGSAFKAPFPKKQHRSLKRRVLIEADRSSRLSVPSFHTFARHT